MGKLEGWKRAQLNGAYEGACGDVNSDGSIPFFVSERATRKDVLKGSHREDGPTMFVTYLIADAALDDADAVALFATAYLDVFARSYYRGKVTRLAFINAVTGATETLPYAE